MSYAHEEILSQPDTWEQTLATVPEQWARVGERVLFHRASHVLFIGCGTSNYLAQTAAQCFQEMTGFASRAIPGSEVFLSPDSNVPRGVPLVAFVISRSGTSSEAVIAARYLNGHYSDVTTIGITCSPNSDLTRECDVTIELPHADDQSVVMTRSFTNMLLALQIIAAKVAGASSVQEELSGIPELIRPQLDEMGAFARRIGRDADLRRVIYLGLGPNYGLAQEATLKLKEMTQVECEPYNPLEFRHGAISMVREGTAVVILAGERERAYIPDLEAHVKRFGAYVGTIAPYGSGHADITVRLPNDLSDVTRSILYLPAVQLLAYERSMLLELDPDAPRNLGHVVVLNAR